MSEQKVNKARSFLRWAGGKRWLAPLISEWACRVSWQRYIEPFLGGGSVFFSVRPNEAILADTNEELINAYMQVKMAPDELERKLKKMPVISEEYYRIRKSSPHEEIDRATRFIYLNRTCFNGIWRTNREGWFNVPYGQGTRSTKTIIGNDTLQKASKALTSSQLIMQDFRKSFTQVTENDLVYCDPAYAVNKSNGLFLRYNEKVFSWKDQVSLRDHIMDALDLGATVVLSNAAHQSIAKLYHPFKPFSVFRNSSVAASVGRGKSEEYIFVFSRRAKDRKSMQDVLRKQWGQSKGTE